MNEQQDDIIQLNYPDCVRIRPGMYIGELDNPSTCLREIIDNSIDECYVSSSCDHIYIYNKDESAIIIDNGRGIPIKKMKDEDITMARSSVTSLHSGSKFNKTQAQVGMNGVGSSVVSALSKIYNLIVKIDDSLVNQSTSEVIRLFNEKRSNSDEVLYYFLNCEKGNVVNESVITLSELKKLIPEVANIECTPSTIVEFYPDPSIFESVRMNVPNTLKYFKYIIKSTQNKEVVVYINDVKYEDSFSPYKFELNCHLTSSEFEPKNPEATFLWSMEFDEEFDSYSNIGSVNGLTVNQGYHIWLSTYSFKEAFKRVFPGFDYRGNEVKGINFCTILLCPEPSFSSQTKERMSGCPGISYVDTEPFIKAIVKLIKNNYDEFLVHQQKVIEYNQMTQNLSKIEYIKSKVPIIAEDGDRRTASMTPIKLRGCSTKDRQEAELFICEGNSAEGSLAIHRDARIHATLPLRGKPRNTAPLSIEEILENSEMCDIIASIGTGIDEYFNLDKIQYGKIIIVADADPDGLCISALISGLFLAHMSYLIKAGMVYICETPLYEQDGNLYYLGEEDELDKNRPFKRFKGLGELPGDIVKRSIFNEDTRRLIRLTMEGADEALLLITNTFARRQLMIKAGIIAQ